MDKKDFLARTILFKDLAPDYLEALAKVTYVKRYRKGEFIFHEGEEARGFYLVYEGQVKVFKQAASGREQIIHVLGPGEPFGEVAVFAGLDYPANASALTDCVLLYLPRKEFVNLIREEPALAMNMLAVLSLRLRQFVSMVEALSLKEVSERLASYLLYRRQKEGDEFDLGMNKGQLASFLGTSPETISRLFGRLSKMGLVESKGRQVKILDHEGLSAVAAGLKPLGKL
ncbi:MAG: Crp/Fnr family transcriptional regulator [Thermodesulfobacteria bacterium]|nr:Crp/Fnr family transcriptional regulator [Thermodesulfobacteriota bacterium]